MPRVCVLVLSVVLACTTTAAAQPPVGRDGGLPQRPRARDLGVPFDGTPGTLNAITDVKGVEVGHVTIVDGDGPLAVGRGPVRTGITAVFPQGRDSRGRVFSAWYTLNGNGEMTGTTWLRESGCLGTPILVTNTHSVGVVRDAVIEWNARKGTSGDYSGDFSLPVVAETWDGVLNDIDGFHVKKDHVFEVLEAARPGPVAEGNVGGGTGMVCHQFKGGIGTSSRVLPAADGGYVVGVLVQANYGLRSQLTIAGVPVGKEIPDLMPQEYVRLKPDATGHIRLKPDATGHIRLKPDATGHIRLKLDATGAQEQGSIIVIVATDAPLLPHQLDRIARRVPLGIGAVGGRGGNSSGDIFVAFSTANPDAAKMSGLASLTMLPNERMNPLFAATAEAVEEAIVNALVGAETMTGINGNRVYALPHDRLRDILKKYNRLAVPRT